MSLLPHGNWGSCAEGCRFSSKVEHCRSPL
uniref:Uncharacterized protein n=1 Tax=Anguilla anguilla TaxID=7936 RepID=A0A0E9TW63_ANGAN